MKHIKWQHHSAERLSQRILYLLLGIVVVVFALFYLIGYHEPYIENTDFNEPVFTNVLMLAMYVLFFGTVGLTIWAVYREECCRKEQSKIVNNIRTSLIRRSVVMGTLVILLLTFALASTTPIVSNGKTFTNSTLLRIADVFINTSIILLIIAIVVAVYGLTRYRRKK